MHTKCSQFEHDVFMLLVMLINFYQCKENRQQCVVKEKELLFTTA